MSYNCEYDQVARGADNRRSVQDRHRRRQDIETSRLQYPGEHRQVV